MTENVSRRIFIGLDPGTKGACAVLAVADCPKDEALHGGILGVEVFDLPVVARANGGHELDVVTFKVALRTALANMCGDRGGATGCNGIVEYPVLHSGFGGGVRQKVQQGVNAGAAWAAMKSTGLVEVEWVDSDKWRTELGGVPKGEEAAAVMKVRQCVDQAGAGAFALAVAADGQVLNDARPDRLVAVLLADVARRRWLGTVVVPKVIGAAKAAQSKKAALRKAAVAHAVAPLTVAKARLRAEAEHFCKVHPNPAMPPAPCLPHNRCCEARLLDWAWRQRPWRMRPDLPEQALPGLKEHPIVALDNTVSIYRKAITSKAWTVARGDKNATETMANEMFVLLESHGLVQLVPEVKQVRYRPTVRGLEWSARLRKAAAP